MLNEMTMMKDALLTTALFALLAAPALASGAVELTVDNFDEAMGSKNAFVKFLAPWVRYVTLRYVCCSKWLYFIFVK